MKSSLPHPPPGLHLLAAQSPLESLSHPCHSRLDCLVPHMLPSTFPSHWMALILPLSNTTSLTCCGGVSSSPLSLEFSSWDTETDQGHTLGSVPPSVMSKMCMFACMRNIFLCVCVSLCVCALVQPCTCRDLSVEIRIQLVLLVLAFRLV